MKRFLVLLTLGSFFVVGCDKGEGLTSKQLELRTTDITVELTRELATTIEFINQIQEFEALVNGQQVLQDMFGSSDVAPQPSPPPADGGAGSGISPDEAAANAKKLLETCIFTASNLESEEPDLAVYLLQGALLCSEDCFNPRGECPTKFCPPGDTLCEQRAQEQLALCQQDQVDQQAQCAANVDTLQIRLEVTSGGTGVNVELQVGPNKSPMLTLVIQRKMLQLSVSLALLKEGLVYISSVLGEKPIELPEIMEGEVSLRLEKNAPQDFTLSAAISQAVHVRVSLPEQGPVDIQMNQADNLSSLRIQGVEKKLQSSVDLNNVLVTLPFASMFDSGVGDFIVDIAGLEANVTLSQDSENHLTITGIGLGEAKSQILHDQTVLAAVDLNQNLGRHFDLTVSTVGEMPLLSFAPGFDLKAYLNLGALNPYLDPAEDPAPLALCDQTYSIQLSATGQDASVMPVESADGTQSALQVVAGTLTLSSTAAAQTVTVAAGQCLAPVDSCPDNPASGIECLAQTACPL